VVVENVARTSEVNVASIFRIKGCRETSYFAHIAFSFEKDQDAIKMRHH
jgi:hypothetical protein